MGFVRRPFRASPRAMAAPHGFAVMVRYGEMEFFVRTVAEAAEFAVAIRMQLRSKGLPDYTAGSWSSRSWSSSCEELEPDGLNMWAADCALPEGEQTIPQVQTVEKVRDIEEYGAAPLVKEHKLVKFAAAAVDPAEAQTVEKTVDEVQTIEVKIAAAPPAKKRWLDLEVEVPPQTAPQSQAVQAALTSAAVQPQVKVLAEPVEKEGPAVERCVAVPPAVAQ